jgi:hypothetical protein
VNKSCSRARNDIAGRASRPSSSPSTKCSAFGCSRLTQRSAGNGLSEIYCKQHIEFRRRHGSTWRRSYKVAEIQSYRKAAIQWVQNNRHDHYVSKVIATLDAMIQNSGPSKSAYDLRWLSSGDRSRQVLARLRDAGIGGDRLLEITLTIKAAISELGPHGNPEFMQVQIAKLAHRLNSGTTQTRSGLPVPPKYPRPEGAFMRVLGHAIGDIASIAATPEVVDEVVQQAHLLK